MEIKKTHFDVAGPSLALEVPIAKVDKENRIVSGFATLDNVDTQGDVVTAEASKEAFANSRLNLRESHTNIAVGKVVDWREQEYYDADNDEWYQGIYVDAYISKGAPNVWEKVIDETLRSFSIGGSVKESKSEIRKSGDGSAKQVRVITKYDLTELSICDAGANQLANVFNIQKIAGTDDTVVSGEVVNIDVRNVLYCKTDGVAIKTTLEKTDCTICERPMENIGWFETASDNDENVAKVRQIVKSFKDSEEGGNEVADNEELHHGDNEEVNATVDSASAEDLPVEEATKTESDDQIVDVPAGAEAPEAGDSTEEEKVEDKPEEETTEDDELVKTISEFQEKIKETLEKGQREHSEALKGLEEKFAKTFGEFETKVTELRESGEGLRKKFDELSGKVEVVEKSLGDIAKTTASKKSGDLGGSASENAITKSKSNGWGGSIFSVDNL